MGSIVSENTQVYIAPGTEGIKGIFISAIPLLKSPVIIR